MRRALFLAAKGEGRVSPNPLVGAVVVRGGKIIGEGWHKEFGGPHAEANALRGIDARGAALYVTLEPCCACVPCKKTPPCVPLIIRSGISRVVIASRDLNEAVCGAEELRAAGIKVEEGLLESEARRLNEAREVFLKLGRAFCALKIAQSADGKIGRRGAGKMAISGRQFNYYIQKLRNRYDAVAVGINTVLEDDPLLTCRLEGGRNPARIILDSRLRIPLGAKALANAKAEKVIVAASARAGSKKASLLRKMGAIVLGCGKDRVDLRRLLYLLPQYGIFSVLLEGGAQVARSALAAGVVDKAIVAASPKKIGRKGAVPSPFAPSFFCKLKAKGQISARRLGKDTVYEAYLTSYSK